MSDEIKNIDEQKTRRSAIKTAAQVAVTAPAVGLLLNASTKSASAAVFYSTSKAGDDAVVKTFSYDDQGLNDNATIFVTSGDDGVGP